MPDEPSETHSNTHLVHRLRWFHSNDGSSSVQSAHQYSISASALLLPRLDVLRSSVWRLGKLQDSLSHRPQVTIITTAVTFIQLQRWLVWHRVMVVVTSKNLTKEHFCTTGSRHPVCCQFHVTRPSNCRQECYFTRLLTPNLYESLWVEDKRRKQKKTGQRLITAHASAVCRYITQCRALHQITACLHFIAMWVIWVCL